MIFVQSIPLHSMQCSVFFSLVNSFNVLQFHVMHLYWLPWAHLSYAITSLKHSMYFEQLRMKCSARDYCRYAVPFVSAVCAIFMQEFYIFVSYW